jgi:hypothetical protein
VTPSEFPLLLKHARRPEAAATYIENLGFAVEAKSIRNVELDNIKFSLGNAAEAVWSKEICEPYFYGGKYQQYGPARAEMVKLYDTILIGSLHDCLSAWKKVNTTKIKDPVIDAMKVVLGELYPLARAAADLKPYVVKGRAPSTGPAKPVNPNKDVKTCPCCFRDIAVTTKTMAHHGYQRPGEGWQTPSCPGVRFAPLEISNAGLIWIRDQTDERLADTAGLLKNLPESKTLPLRVAQNKTIDITPDHPQWARVMDFRKRELDHQVNVCQRAIKDYNARLEIWKPAVAEGRPVLSGRPSCEWDKAIGSALASVATPTTTRQL